MAEQNFKNHTRWDPPFHFFLTPLLAINFLLAVKHAWDYPNAMTLWLVLFAAGLVVWQFKTRLYPLGVQDRLIRLEERVRMEKLLPAELMARFDELSAAQIVGLRFASDAELSGLTRRALDERLTPKQIKAAIQNWRPDHMRI